MQRNIISKKCENRKLKKAVLILLCLLTLCCTDVLAAKKVEPIPENPMDWRISTNPEPTEEEKEAARWSLILENELGLYAYNMDTLGFVPDKKGNADTSKVQVTVKTLFHNEKMLKNLKQQYASKLKGKEKVQYCLLDMQYNMNEKTYMVKEMRVFTNKDRIIETKKNTGGFTAIPEKSFAEAMFEICQQFAAATAVSEEPGKTPPLLSKN